MAQGNGGLGEGQSVITFANISRTDCLLVGYPTLSLAAPGRRTVTAALTVPGHFTDQGLGRAPAPTTVNLRPADEAVAWFGWVDEVFSDDPGANCLMPTGERVYLPGSHTAIDLTVVIRPLVCLNLVIEPVEPITYSPQP